MLHAYARLAASRGFLGYTIGGGCATTAIYAFIGAAPFIFTGQLHRPPHEVGIYLGVNVIGVWFGSLTASRLIGRISMGRLMVVGNLISCASAAVDRSTQSAGACSESEGASMRVG